MLTRRQLTVSAFSLAASAYLADQAGFLMSLTPNTLSTNPLFISHRFCQTVECRYPMEMTFEEFTEKSRDWTLPDYIPHFDLKYADAGSLLKIDRTVSSGYVRWVYTFVNRSAFEEWSVAAGREKLFRHTHVPKEFSYTFKYTDYSNNGQSRDYISQGFPLGMNLDAYQLTPPKSTRRLLGQILSQISDNT